MNRLAQWLVSWIFSCAALAAEVKDAPIPEQTDTVGIMVFAALFFGLCIGFFVFVWLRNKDGDGDDKQ